MNALKDEIILDDLGNTIDICGLEWPCTYMIVQIKNISNLKNSVVKGYDNLYAPNEIPVVYRKNNSLKLLNDPNRLTLAIGSKEAATLRVAVLDNLSTPEETALKIQLSIVPPSPYIMNFHKAFGILLGNPMAMKILRDTYGVYLKKRKGKKLDDAELLHHIFGPAIRIAKTIRSYTPVKVVSVSGENTKPETVSEPNPEPKPKTDSDQWNALQKIHGGLSYQTIQYKCNDDQTQRFEKTVKNSIKNGRLKQTFDEIQLVLKEITQIIKYKEVMSHA